MEVQMCDEHKQHDAATTQRYLEKDKAEAAFRRHVRAKLNQELAAHKAMQKEYNRVRGPRADGD